MTQGRGWYDMSFVRYGDVKRLRVTDSKREEKDCVSLVIWTRSLPEVFQRWLYLGTDKLSAMMNSKHL